MAAWRAVSFCRECGFNKVLLEGDSLLVVSELCKVTPCTSCYGTFIEYTTTHLAMMVESEIRHIRHTANLAAHQLAKMVLVHSLDSV
jgi:ribonuclease HI